MRNARAHVLLSLLLLAYSDCVREIYPQAQYEESDAGALGAAVCPAGLEPFSVGQHGLIKTDPSTQLSVRVNKANYPPKRGMNTWQVVITDAAGQPAKDVHISWACSWMPVHKHGKTPRRIERTADGVFTLGDQNMSMTGPWEVQLWLDPRGQEPEYLPQDGANIADGMPCIPTNGVTRAPNVVFKLCVPEVL